MSNTFSALDLIIIVGYLVVLAAVGAYFSRRQTSLDSFLVAGGRMTWLPVGMSLMAALNSGIDYLTQPSATIQYGLVLILGTLSWLAIYPWVSRVVFPFYRRLSFYSIYEYLEARFDVRVRTLAAAIFIAWRLGWMATALYVPCLAIDEASGGQIDLTLMIVVAGVAGHALHHARRHSGGDLQRRHPVLRDVRRPRRDGADRRLERAGRRRRKSGPLPTPRARPRCGCRWLTDSAPSCGSR